MLVYEKAGFRVHAIHAGRIRLDGGAMFGVVPKPLWEKRIPADERNRIPLAMRCLVVETGERTVLIDDGVGNKETGKFRNIYGVHNAGSPTRLEDELRELEIEPEDIDTVLLTHLHFDHAGGSTLEEEDGEIRPAFPNATYVIRRGEWDFAHRDNERIQASYLAHNMDPLESAGVVEFIDEDTEVVPGITMVRTPGHTPYHQSALIRHDGTTLFYLADLVPTTAHLPLPWIMGYDVEPLVTLDSKREWLTRAAEEGWVLVFEHDPEVAYGWARPREARGGCELASPERHPVEGGAGGEDGDEVTVIV